MGFELDQEVRKEVEKCIVILPTVFQILSIVLSIELQKPPREPQGYQRYRTSGRGTIANQWKRKNNIDQQAGP